MMVVFLQQKKTVVELGTASEDSQERLKDKNKLIENSHFSEVIKKKFQTVIYWFCILTLVILVKKNKKLFKVVCQSLFVQMNMFLFTRRHSEN